MSLKISSFCTPEIQNFVFRNAGFPILVDLVAYRCLKKYAHAPAYSTLAGLFSLGRIAYGSPFSLQILGAGIYLAYKATAFVISHFSTPKIEPKQPWDDIKIFAVLNMILPIEESQDNVEGLYIIPGPHAKITSLATDPGKSTIEQFVTADVNILAGLVKELLKKMDPPLLTPVKDQLEKAASLQDEAQKGCISQALQRLSPIRKAIFVMLIRHLHMIAQKQTLPQTATSNLAQLFSQNFIGGFSPTLNQVITVLIQKPHILK